MPRNVMMFGPFFFFSVYLCYSISPYNCTCQNPTNFLRSLNQTAISLRKLLLVQLYGITPCEFSVTRVLLWCYLVCSICPIVTNILICSIMYVLLYSCSHVTFKTARLCEKSDSSFLKSQYGLAECCLIYSYYTNLTCFFILNS